MTLTVPRHQEWLEPDGLGGFASGTVGGERRRRYHALLLSATTPPTSRFVLVNGFDAWLDFDSGNFPISAQRYTPNTLEPRNEKHLESYVSDPWPSWVFRFEDDVRVSQEIFVPHGQPLVAIRWRLVKPNPHTTLIVRPFLSGRDYHALHKENPNFHFEADVVGTRLRWRPYPGIPSILSLSNGEYVHQPVWYRNFLYDEERERGLDHSEDLASPGIFRWDISSGEAIWILGSDQAGEANEPVPTPTAWYQQLASTERQRRNAFPTRLHRAADSFIVRRGRGKSILAGYPWFTDWGRWNFAALRGLCLATKRLDDAGQILQTWAESVSEGLLPNCYTDYRRQPEFGSVDAGLWFVVAVHDYLQAREQRGERASEEVRLRMAIDAIMSSYQVGARYRIRCDSDGLLACGEPGLALTWMDAHHGNVPLTPRIGKPVDVQALWLNALKIVSVWQPRFLTLHEKALKSFRERFWHGAGGYLHDVIDVDHQAGSVDSALRPNQIFAVGGLPFGLLEDEKAIQVVNVVEQRLWTPHGLRTLPIDATEYQGHYVGTLRERESAYHQGTAWPWLLGPFVEAWVRCRGSSLEAKREARQRFLNPWLQQFQSSEQFPELADGNEPFQFRGCPFYSATLGEALRLAYHVLEE